jgi:hypothetical protein
MKRFLVALLAFAILISFAAFSSVQVFARSVTVKEQIESEAEFTKKESKDPHESGFLWGDFALLGKYAPMSTPPTDIYRYKDADRIYNLRISNPLETYYSYVAYLESEEDAENSIRKYCEVWQEYAGVVGEMSVKQYYDVEYDAMGRSVYWDEMASADTIDLTTLRERGNKNMMVYSLDGRIVYQYSAEGLNAICFMYDGWLFELMVEIETQSNSTLTKYGVFGKEDMALVRELCDQNGNYGALANLFATVDQYAVDGMEKGIDKPEKDPNAVDSGIDDDDNGGDDGEEASYEGSMSMPWKIVWGSVLVITFLYLVVMAVGIFKKTKRR